MANTIQFTSVNGLKKEGIYLDCHGSHSKHSHIKINISVKRKT